MYIKQHPRDVWTLICDYLGNTIEELLPVLDIAGKAVQMEYCLDGTISASTAQLGKGANITSDVLLRICEALDYDIAEITEVIKDEKSQ
jgi:hypothetical protein